MPVTFEGFGTDIEKYKAAFGQAKTIVGKAYASAESIRRNAKMNGEAFANARKAYTRFWGGNDSDEVARQLRYLKNALFNDLTIKFDATDKTAKAYIFDDDVAKVIGGDYTAEMYFCPPLLNNYAALGTNSAAGTIVHELSHLVLRTEDHKYGMKSVTEISDQQKLTNADNFKYYCELFQLVNLSNLPVLSDAYDLSHVAPKKK